MVHSKIVHIAILPLLLALVACRPEATYLTASVERIYAPMEGQIDTMIIHSDGRPTLVHYPLGAWCEYADSTLVISLPPNTKGHSIRDSIVFIIDGDTLSLTIPVYQHYVPHTLKARRHRIDFAQSGGTDTIDVDTDVEVLPQLTVPEGFSATYWANNQLVVSCTEQSGHMTHGWLVLRAEGMADSIFLHQDGTVCPTCGGSGWVRCPDCKGAGYVSTDGSTQHMKGCPTCGGSGDYFDWDHLTPGRGSIPCPDCQ